jgi:signal transduction histidine kinase
VGDVKNKKNHQVSLMSMIMKAVYGIGFGILGLTIGMLILLSVISDKHLFSSQAFARFEAAMVIGYFCAVIFIIIAIPFWTAKKLRKKGQSIINVSEKIKVQDLNFDISLSGIKEIDLVLDSMDDMRSALKAALETQWRLEQNRKEQISALAHDFKTPITVLKGNIDLLQCRGLNYDCKEYVEDMKYSLKEIELYLSQILELSKAESGYVINKQKTELGELIDDIISRLKGASEGKEIEILSDKCKEDILVSADSNLLRRAFTNLLSNALDYTPQKGTIKIVATTVNGKAEISITDSGCGFSSTALRHGTEQFFMGDISRGNKAHYGLGLYIVETIIKQHNGIIQLENDHTTGGARVIIQIPLVKVE